MKYFYILNLLFTIFQSYAQSDNGVIPLNERRYTASGRLITDKTLGVVGRNQSAERSRVLEKVRIDAANDRAVAQQIQANNPSNFDSNGGPGPVPKKKYTASGKLITDKTQGVVRAGAISNEAKQYLQNQRKKAENIQVNAAQKQKQIEVQKYAPTNIVDESIMSEVGESKYLEYQKDKERLDQLKDKQFPSLDGRTINFKPMTILYVILSILAIFIGIRALVGSRNMKMFTTSFLFPEVQRNTADNLLRILNDYEDTNSYLESIMPQLDEISFNVYEVALVKLKNRNMGKEYLANIPFSNSQKILFIQDFEKKLEAGYFANRTGEDILKYVDQYSTSISEYMHIM